MCDLISIALSMRFEGLLCVNLKVCCVFSLESPHRGDSNEYIQYTIFNLKKKITLNYPKSAVMGFSQGAQERVRNSRDNEPSVSEPLKFYCICVRHKRKISGP